MIPKLCHKEKLHVCNAGEGEVKNNLKTDEFYKISRINYKK